MVTINMGRELPLRALRAARVRPSLRVHARVVRLVVVQPVRLPHGTTESRPVRKHRICEGGRRRALLLGDARHRRLELLEGEAARALGLVLGEGEVDVRLREPGLSEDLRSVWVWVWGFVGG